MHESVYVVVSFGHAGLVYQNGYYDVAHKVPSAATTTKSIASVSNTLMLRRHLTKA